MGKNKFLLEKMVLKNVIFYMSIIGLIQGILHTNDVIIKEPAVKSTEFVNNAQQEVLKESIKTALNPSKYPNDISNTPVSKLKKSTIINTDNNSTNEVDTYIKSKGFKKEQAMNQNEYRTDDEDQDDLDIDKKLDQAKVNKTENIMVTNSTGMDFAPETLDTTSIKSVQGLKSISSIKTNNLNGTTTTESTYNDGSKKIRTENTDGSATETVFGPEKDCKTVFNYDVSKKLTSQTIITPTYTEHRNYGEDTDPEYGISDYSYSRMKITDKEKKYTTGSHYPDINFRSTNKNDKDVTIALYNKMKKSVNNQEVRSLWDNILESMGLLKGKKLKQQQEHFKQQNIKKLRNPISGDAAIAKS